MVPDEFSITDALDNCLLFVIDLFRPKINGQQKTILATLHSSPLQPCNVLSEPLHWT